MSNPKIETKTLGGLRFNPATVKSQRTFKAKNGETKYELIFQNNQKIVYPEQKRGAYVDYLSHENIKYDGLTLNDADNAYVTGAKGRIDDIYLASCTNSQVNVLDQDNKNYFEDKVHIYSKNDDGTSHGNEVIMDRNDNTQIMKSSKDGYKVYTGSLFVRENPPKIIPQ